LTLAPTEGLGVRDQALREQHLAAINRFRNR
jgi:crotonyl-CoA reductase